jgi:hypothetical protein
MLSNCIDWSTFSCMHHLVTLSLQISDLGVFKGRQCGFFILQNCFLHECALIKRRVRIFIQTFLYRYLHFFTYIYTTLSPFSSLFPNSVRIWLRFFCFWQCTEGQRPVCALPLMHSAQYHFNWNILYIKRTRDKRFYRCMSHWCTLHSECQLAKVRYATSWATCIFRNCWA